MHCSVKIVAHYAGLTAVLTLERRGRLQLLWGAISLTEVVWKDHPAGTFPGYRVRDPFIGDSSIVKARDAELTTRARYVVLQVLDGVPLGGFSRVVGHADQIGVLPEDDFDAGLKRGLLDAYLDHEVVPFPRAPSGHV